MPKIRADCFAVVIEPGKLVHVRRRAPFTGIEGEWLDYDPSVWETSGGEYGTNQLRPVGRDLALTIIFGLLDTGADIRFEDGNWRINALPL